jgi:hypothetical protein
MILSTYATFEQMHGRRSSISELIDKLSPFSRESVISLCSYISILLKLWDRGASDLARYDHLVSCAFEELRGNWCKLAARLSEPELVFHRRQQLLITKLATLHCSKDGIDAWKAPPGYLGTILLMANDHFHYDLPAGATSDEIDKIQRLFAEFIPVSESAAFIVEFKIIRSHLMLRYANRMKDHPEFIDIPAEFQNAKGLSLDDYEALCFGLFAKCATLTLESLQHGAAAFTFGQHNFSAMAIAKDSVAIFLDEMATTPEDLATRIQQKDYGANDFTELRKRPMYSGSRGHFPMDILFLIEKFETGPYWTINNISKPMGDRLRRFWGTVFETYMNELLGDSLKQTGVLFVPDPRRADDSACQICDALVLHGEALILLEYKSSMFRADNKYTGNFKLLIKEMEKKLVRDSAESKKKGVEQLSDAIIQLFGGSTRNIIKDLNLSAVTRVYPLLVTLDGIGGNLLMSRLLNHYFDAFMRNHKFDEIVIKPLLCTDVESIEEISACFSKMSLAGFLDHWLSKDPNLLASLGAHIVPELEGQRNERMAREWHLLSEEISQRAFPEEYRAARTTNEA